jgi:Protein of unknown function, DUF488
MGKESCAAGKGQRVFFAVAYQRHGLRAFGKNNIALVFDVHQNPISRKAGFSGSRLQAALEPHGIKYAHCPCLDHGPRSVRLPVDQEVKDGK